MVNDNEKPGSGPVNGLVRHPTVCPHGGLKRSCEACQLADELGEAWEESRLLRETIRERGGDEDMGRAVNYYHKYTLEELVVMEKAAWQDGNKKKQADCQWAITWHLRDRRIARGEKPNDEGYSGRQTNRR